MILSMTGFGRATAEYAGKKISIECRSLNSKQLDLNLRLFSGYKEKESEMRALAAKYLERGKVDIIVMVEGDGTESAAAINRDLALKYYNEIKALRDITGDQSTVGVLEMVMRLPDVIKQQKEELSDEEWKVVEKALINAMEHMTAFRASEGGNLAQDLLGRINSIREQMSHLEPFEEERKAGTRARLQKALDDAMGKENVDQNRFEQELIYYLEKFDVTEEKVRLTTHLNYFEECTNSTANEGRKLGFIAQEIGREINTMGSKANHAGIQRLVVQMKDDLEKIKEQVLNVL